MEPSKEFLTALSNEQKRLAKEVAKLSFQQPDVYKDARAFAEEYTRPFEKKYPMLAIELVDYIMRTATKIKNQAHHTNREEDLQSHEPNQDHFD